MAILKVARLGHPVLRTKAVFLGQDEIISGAIQKLMDDMIDTMRDHDGVGLAAPQVHISKQIVVIESAKNSRYADSPAIPLTILLNPKIKNASKAKGDDWEGCLSIPDMRGLVPRNEWVLVEAFDRSAKRFELRADGFFARVVQHELDHLEGLVFLDRMSDFSSLSYLQEFNHYGGNP